MRTCVERLKIHRLLVLLSLLPVFSLLVGFQGECQSETPAWRAMQLRPALLIGPQGQKFEIQVKVADEEFERRAGFQHICPRTVARLPMLFYFQRSLAVAFHMRNVHAPLEIGFFDDNGVLIDIQLMQPYAPDQKKRRLYGPGKPVRAALETAVGFYREHGITPGGWRLRFPVEK